MKYKSLIFFFIAALLVVGCKKSYLDVNTNPNSTPSATTDVVFTNALNTTVNNEVAQNDLGSYFAGQRTQSSSYILTTSIFAYQFSNSDFNFYDPIYNNLEDYQYVINNADATKQPFLKGPSKVMKAYLFQKLVDLYGNVPFSEALKGLANLAPKFDDQKAIYEALIPLLDSAIIDLKANPFPGAFQSSDISLFKSNTTKWIRFANSLKLRILIRQSRIVGRDPYIITEIKKAVAEGSGFLGAGEDAGVNPGYLASAGKQNPFYDLYGYSETGSTRGLARYPRPTKFLFDQLITRDDTFRLKRLAYAKGGENPNNPGVSKNAEIVSNYVGVPFGAGSGFTAPSTSYLGPSVIIKGQFNRPQYIMIAAESQFLLSEAVQRYGATLGLTKTAKEFYEQGVRESFRLDGVQKADAAATTLLTSGKPEADWNASPDKLKAIWLQKWIALTNFEGLEAWSEYRRTNYPPIPASLAASSSQPAPLRLFYPNTELGSNEANVLAQGKIDVFTSRIFWDVD